MHMPSTRCAARVASVAMRLTRSGCRSPCGNVPVPPVAIRTKSKSRREIALLGGDVSKFVSPHVWQRLMTKKEAGTKP